MRTRENETDEREGALPPPAPKPNGGGMIAVAQQREMAEVQAAIILARQFPRDEKRAIDRILQACTRPALAENALYSYVRGGTEVTGESIRLAEVLAQNWQNFDFGIRELDQRDGESTVEAYAWDIENNVRQRKTFQVPHVRYSKLKGHVLLIDPRDIYEMVANQGARRLRACILGVIPGDVKEQAVKQCETTLAAKAEVTPERLKNLVEKFGEIKVTKEMIETRIQRRLESITPALLIQLGKIYNSIKDGMSAPADWFAQPKEPEKGTLKVEDLQPGKEENRGHGQENLQKAAPKEEPPKQPEQKAAPKPKGKAKPGDNPNYAAGDDGDPFKDAGGNLFAEREPGSEG